MGFETEVQIQGQVLCPHCRGSGAKDDSDMKKCSKCQGEGFVLKRRQLAPGFVQQVQQQCNSCEGKGTIVRNKCPRCKGEKVIEGNKILDVAVEAGMKDGELIEYANAGDEHPDKNGESIFCSACHLAIFHFRVGTIFVNVPCVR